MLTIFGALAVSFMMLMYALERRDQRAGQRGQALTAEHANTR